MIDPLCAIFHNVLKVSQLHLGLCRIQNVSDINARTHLKSNFLVWVLNSFFITLNSEVVTMIDSLCAIFQNVLKVSQLHLGLCQIQNVSDINARAHLKSNFLVWVLNSFFITLNYEVVTMIDPLCAIFHNVLKVRQLHLSLCRIQNVSDINPSNAEATFVQSTTMQSFLKNF